jgi:Tfp pilus assembly protein PilE
MIVTVKSTLAMQSHKIEKGMYRAQYKKGGNSNLIDCNAITQNKKGGNSNSIDCNTITQNKKGRQLQFNRLQCNHTK